MLFSHLPRTVNLRRTLNVGLRYALYYSEFCPGRLMVNYFVFYRYEPWIAVQDKV